jgi:hypothetical protein
VKIIQKNVIIYLGEGEICMKNGVIMDKININIKVPTPPPPPDLFGKKKKSDSGMDGLLRAAKEALIRHALENIHETIIMIEELVASKHGGATPHKKKSDDGKDKSDNSNANSMQGLIDLASFICPA